MTSRTIIPIAKAPEEWRYGLYFRPASIGAVPNGYLRIDDASVLEKSHARHGVIVYGHPLSDAEIRSYELIPFLGKEDFNALVQNVGDKMSKYARGYAEMAVTDPECFLGTVVEMVSKCAGHRVYVADYDVFSTAVLNRIKQSLVTQIASSSE